MPDVIPSNAIYGHKRDSCRSTAEASHWHQAPPSQLAGESEGGTFKAPGRMLIVSGSLFVGPQRSDRQQSCEAHPREPIQVLVRFWQDSLQTWRRSLNVHDHPSCLSRIIPAGERQWPSLDKLQFLQYRLTHVSFQLRFRPHVVNDTEWIHFLSPAIWQNLGSLRLVDEHLALIAFATPTLSRLIGTHGPPAPQSPPAVLKRRLSSFPKLDQRAWLSSWEVVCPRPKINFGRESLLGLDTGAAGKAKQPGWKPCVTTMGVRARFIIICDSAHMSCIRVTFCRLHLYSHWASASSRPARMAGRDAPLFANTKADKGAIVVVVTFATIVITTLCTSIRSAIRFQKHRRLGLDDGMLIAANVSATRASHTSKTVEYVTDQWLADTGNRTKCRSGTSGQLWPGAAHRYFEQCLDGSILPGS